MPTAPSSTSMLPNVSLPKGGGAIRGLGEKFSTSAVSGTGGFTIPLEAPPGRSGFGPRLSLTYDSGLGNGPFGLGWHLPVPAISRKTDKGLPRYGDGEESDVFVLSDVEDLVPALTQAADGWLREARIETRDGDAFKVEGYRPRIETLHARIERWTNAATGEAHWRVISHDNVTSRYGLTRHSRISDPDNPAHVYSWLICETYDDRGNAMVYSYKPEDSTGVDSSRAHERNRTVAGRAAQRYLKRIRYGNQTPRQPGEDLGARTDWLFECVCDYGEHYQASDSGPTFVSASDAERSWPVRADPFSSYRPGFETRTYRLCRRVLVFHHFPKELGTADCLVRAMHFSYQETPVASFLSSVTRSGYVRQSDGTYLERSFPPLEVDYSPGTLHTEVREVDAASLANLPAGVESQGYAWVDLDGDGVAGILAEQPGGWLYKRNLSPLVDGTGVRFAPEREVVDEPVGAVTPGQRWRWLDVRGDGQPDLVQLGGMVTGYHERRPDGAWEPFAPFASSPNLSWESADVQLVDLTGDGRPDALVFADDALTWYPAIGDAGFGRAERVPHPFDEEQGPRVLLSDAAQSIHLADLSGDGLTDVVRIRNGEVCYWPNLGYGRFGAKVSMDDAPWFDTPDRFDARRLRLADVDGSGPTDLVYLGDDGVRLYANQSGNGWAAAAPILDFPLLSGHESVQVLDVLGNGTACLVWSSELPGESGRQVRYVDLMGGSKPHLLVGIRNNLGAETRVRYAPSTRFAIADDLAGRPWVTRLPFPVHVVERVEVYDWISRSRFVTRYAYHHGHFDGYEREFRGFGMVEQWDTEEHRGDADFPGADAVNWDEASWSPPSLTRTWFHTGAYLESASVSRQYAHEYWTEPALRPEDRVADREAMCLPDTVVPEGLTADELREAYRALKSTALRKETYGKDGSGRAEHPYSVVEHSFAVRLLQPSAGHRHAVFVTHPRETLSFEYERRPEDPRVSHSVTLEVDGFGNVLRSVSIGYPRRAGHPEPEPTLSAAFRSMLAHDQRRLHIAGTKNRFTNALTDAALDPATHRAPLPSETITAELKGFVPAANRPEITNLFRVDELEAAWQTWWGGTHDVPYEQVDASDIDGVGAPSAAPTRRIVEHARTLYRRDDLTGLLVLGKLESRALPGESYRLAFTPSLLTRIFGSLVSEAMLTEGGYVQLPGGDGRWVPSGRVAYSPGDADTPAQELAEAAAHFFQPRRAADPFGGNTRVTFDAYDVLPVGAADAAGNTTSAENDYRVLQPFRVTDPNGNRSEDAFDALGHVVGTAVMGKTSESVGDSLAGFVADLDEAVVAAHAADPLANADFILGHASARMLYDHSAYFRTRNDPEPKPPFVYTVRRETHASELAAGEKPRYRHACSYSDGFGREIQHKMQAESGPVADAGPDVEVRWVGSGWTIANNKGLPVRQYEPFFSATPGFEFAPKTGVSSVLLYDAIGRVVARLHPDSTWSKDVFDSWRRDSWDASDTVAIADPRSDADVGEHFRRLLGGDAAAFTSWYEQLIGGTFGSTPDARAAQQDAAKKTWAHAGTPGASHFDSLGRACLAVSDNGPAGRSANRTALDAENKPLAVIDALGRHVLELCLREPRPDGGFDYAAGYGISGVEIYRNAMDGGSRRVLEDAAGKAIRQWDDRGHVFRTRYDPLRRPTHVYVGSGAGPEILLERSIYGEGAAALNLCGRLARKYDSAGVAISERYDFEGNLLRTTRQFAREYRTSIDWSAVAEITDPVLLDAAAAPLLSAADRFVASSTYDALGRPVQMVAPHSAAMRPSVTRISYNHAGLLERLDVWPGLPAEPAAPLDPGTADVHVVSSVDYDARGKRIRVTRGNGSVTAFEYDPETFRLARLTTTRPESFGAEARLVQDLSYFYDPSGNVTRIRDDADIHDVVFFKNSRVDPSGDYTYDALYRLTRATGREHLGQNANALSAPVQVSDDEGPRTGLMHPGDGHAMGTYEETYAYDPAGNPIEVLHQVSSGSWTRRFSYAEASLVAATESGNRLSATSLPGDTAAGPYSATCKYDAHGNVVRMPHLPGLAWDEHDRLRSTTRQVVAADKTPETTFYTYGTGGDRLRKVTDRQAQQAQSPAMLKQRLYLGTIEIYREFAADGTTVTLERETLNVSAGGERVALIETRTAGTDPSPAQVARFQYTNHLGSATLELDLGSNVISYEEYFPYGSTAYQAVRSQTETTKRHRYTAKERDEETSLYHIGARLYAPWIMRWISCDPQTAPNAYWYARSNPLMWVDPSGNFDMPSFSQVIDAADRYYATPVLNGITTGVGYAGQYVAVPLVELVFGGSAANAPTSETEQRYEAEGYDEQAAKIALTIGGGALFKGVYNAAYAVSGWRLFATVTAGVTSGGIVAPAMVAAHDASQGQLGSASTYWDAAKTGAFVGGMFGLIGGLLHEAQTSNTAAKPRSPVRQPTPEPIGRPRATEPAPTNAAPSQPAPPAARPAPTAADVIAAMERHVAAQNARVANAIRSGNRGFFGNLGMSARQIGRLMSPGGRTFPAQYGNALERAVARAFRSDSSLSRFLVDARNLSGRFFPGRMRPDLGFARGPLEGQIGDLSTVGSRAGKLLKYHDRAIVLEYERPSF